MENVVRDVVVKQNWSVVDIRTGKRVNQAILCQERKKAMRFFQVSSLTATQDDDPPTIKTIQLEMAWLGSGILPNNVVSAPVDTSPGISREELVDNGRMFPTFQRLDRPS